MPDLDYTLSLVEPGIIFCECRGDINRLTFVDLTENRLHFADEHGLKQYAFLWDISHARITVMDVRLAQWATRLDDRLVYAVLIGQPSIASIFVNVVSKLTGSRLAISSSYEAALPLARAQLGRDVAPPPG
ncbi:MAG: hypothetical protein MUE40_21875 [Anaerolineae bacterium]|jgi:hypothetical protein|nr:hypothetical protein [Anaerolineae bacterium]